MYTIGIDLGGTNIATAVVDEHHKIIGRGALPTNAPRPGEQVARDMVKTIHTACTEAGIRLDDVEWIGVGTPGTVNQKNGMIESYGEFIAGAGRGTSSLVAITLGTGVGGGVIIDGKIFSGSNYCGTELGHTCIILNGEVCGCGRTGCWEAYASATALIRQTKAAMQTHPESAMWKLAPTLEQVDGKTAFDGWRAGDATATQVVDQYIEYVACGIVDMINIFQPELLCIGGGISKEKDNLLIPIRKYVEKNRYSKHTVKQTKITIAELGNDAGIIGAAMLGLLAK